MARGAIRGAMSGALTLIVLQGLTGKASGRVGDLVDAITGLVSRAIDPTVPAIPDHSTPAAAAATGPAPSDPLHNGFIGPVQNITSPGTNGATARRIPIPALN